MDRGEQEFDWTWEEFVEFNQSQPDKDFPWWDHEAIYGPLKSKKWKPARQVRFLGNGIDMLNDDHVERKVIDKGEV